MCDDVGGGLRMGVRERSDEINNLARVPIFITLSDGG
jgi:hypothetical protein